MAFTSKSERKLDFGLPSSRLSNIPKIQMTSEQADNGMILMKAIPIPQDNLPAHKEYNIEAAKAPFNSSVVKEVNPLPVSKKHLPGMNKSFNILIRPWNVQLGCGF
jgi:hypothetical protein